MMVELKNEQLSVVVSEKGAELQSIKDASGKEYLWQADPKYWNRRSPILFPIVCSVNDETYRVDGKEYHLPRHGFARDSEFKLIAQSPRKVTFVLESSEATKKVYPYDFTLSVSYVLDANKISVIWHVHNTDTREIHFQIGGHPQVRVRVVVSVLIMKSRWMRFIVTSMARTTWMRCLSWRQRTD